MPPVKVLHLIPTLSGGGAERQLVNLIRTTSRELVEHTVCTITNAEFFAPHIREAGYKVIDLGIDAKRPFFKAGRKFRQLIATERPDVINSWLYDANIVSRLAAFPLNSVPLITSLQSADYEPSGIRAAGWHPGKVRFLKTIDQITAKLSQTYFVACSNFVKQSYNKNFRVNRNRTETIYNSVNITALASQPISAAQLRSELGLPDDAFIYLFVGRIDAAKNQRLAIAAFEQVKTAVPKAFLLLAGAGPQEAEMRQLTKSLNIDDRVLFLGMRNDVGSLLRFADVFVFPSLLEGLPVALAEAMYNGLPCIASNIEVFEEVIDDRETGLLIDPASVDSLRDAMIELYKLPELRKSLGEKALRAASAKFNATLTAKQWEDLYMRIALQKNA